MLISPVDYTGLYEARNSPDCVYPVQVTIRLQLVEIFQLSDYVILGAEWVLALIP